MEHIPDDFRAITHLPRLVEDLQKSMTASGDTDLSEFVSLDTLYVMVCVQGLPLASSAVLLESCYIVLPQLVTLLMS